MGNRCKNVNPNFSVTLKRLRENKQLTQSQVGKIVNKGESTVRMWELRNSEPDHETLVKLADYFNVSVDYLLGRQDNSQSEWTEEDYANGVTDKVRIEVNTRQYKWLELGDEVYNKKGEDYYNALVQMIKTMKDVK